MRKSLVSTMVFASIILTACGKSEATQTVDYYKNHDVERKEMLEKCRNEMGAKAAASDNCINATKAKTALETSAGRNTYTELEVLKPSDLSNLGK